MSDYDRLYDCRRVFYGFARREAEAEDWERWPEDAATEPEYEDEDA